MNSLIKKICAFALCMIMCMSVLTSCMSAKVTPAISFGFKTTGGAGKYDESIDEFEIGKDFYTCINIKLVTDKKRATDYKVVIEVPKTKDIEVDVTGGKRADSTEWDTVNEKSILTFTISGSKEATSQKILFKGKPMGEGSNVMSLMIYDLEGNAIDAGYFRTIFFVYEVE